VDAKAILSKQATVNPTIHFTDNPENHPITAKASSYAKGKSGHPTRKNLQPTREVLIKAIDNLQIRNAQQASQLCRTWKQGCT
jgi:predicted DNA-binding protein with PD1-like motif